MNCSTAAARHLASSGVDVYSAVAGAVGALYGPLHGGANVGCAQDARADRLGGEHPVVPRWRQEQKGEDVRVRPPRVQEL